MRGGPARKKARIVICGNFQEVHPDKFTTSKTPSYPSEWLCQWHLIWDGQLNVGMSRRHSSFETEILIQGATRETEVVSPGVVWKIKKALYGLRTSPIAWETERDNTLKDLRDGATMKLSTDYYHVLAHRVCGLQFHSDKARTHVSRPQRKISPEVLSGRGGAGEARLWSHGCGGVMRLGAGAPMIWSVFGLRDSSLIHWCVGPYATSRVLQSFVQRSS